MSSSEKPKIKFTARHLNGRVYMKAACPVSECLMLLTNRLIEPKELNIVAKMGFDIEVVGDMKKFKEEIRRVKGEE